MGHNDVELHNSDEVEEEAQVADENEETDNDYLMERDRPRIVIPSHFRDLVMQIS